MLLQITQSFKAYCSVMLLLQIPLSFKAYCTVVCDAVVTDLSELQGLL